MKGSNGAMLHAARKLAWTGLDAEVAELMVRFLHTIFRCKPLQLLVVPLSAMQAENDSRNILCFGYSHP